MKKEKTTQDKILELLRRDFPPKNACSGHLKKHHPDCQGCFQVLVVNYETLESWLSHKLTKKC